MTAKEYLTNIGVMKKQIAVKKEKVRMLDLIATNTTQTLTGMPHNPSKTTSRIADTVCLKASLQEEIAKITAARDAAIAYLFAQPDTDETNVLIKRYVRELTWDEIADEMYISRRSVIRIHTSALRTFIPPKR